MSNNYYLKNSKFNLHRPKQKKWLGRFFKFHKFFRYRSNISNKIYKKRLVVIVIAVVIITTGFFHIIF